MHIYFSLLLLFSITLQASIYDEYTITQENNVTENYFMYTTFEEIIHFDALVFDNEELSSESDDYLEKILEQIDNVRDSNLTLRITLIGHTSATTDDKNENHLASNTYAKKLQNLFTNTLDTSESIKRSKSYAKEIQQRLIDEGIDENSTFVEYRQGLDNSFSTETENGYDLSNRVMVTLYVEKELDLDKDGVKISMDECPNTLPNMKVSKNGCKYRTIVVLLDNDKQQNAIEVKTKESTVLLESANNYALIKSKNEIVEVLENMSETQKKNLFGDVYINSIDKSVKFKIYFNDLDLVQDSEKKLKNIIDVISKNKDAYISIIGHTDAKGTNTHNDKLAQNRAQMVAQKIRDSNTSYLHLRVESYGEYNLAVKTADEVREPLNKRVEILIR